MLLTRPEKSWILYDVANSAFVLIVTTTLMPIFFKSHAARGVDPDTATSWWGLTVSAASLAVAVSAPLIGTLADYRGNKKKIMILAIVSGMAATLLCGAVRPGQWLLCLVLYGLARFGFATANICYDAFLTDVTTADRMDRISARGFGWGYIGSVVPFLLALAGLVLTRRLYQTETFPAAGFMLAFFIAAAWWGLFSLPLLKNVRQVYFAPPAARPVRDSFVTLYRTLSRIRRYRDVFLFLLAYFFYIDGVYTIISMAMAFGLDLKLSQGFLIGVILFIQVLAWPFAILFGNLAERFSARGMILAGIGIYSLLTVTAFFLPVINNSGLQVGLFYLMGFLIALAQGGIQSLSRSFFGKMIPPHRAAEFFGFYNIFGKFAAILGPALMGVATLATGSSRYGVLSILSLFLIGGILLTKVKPSDQDPARLRPSGPGRPGRP
ncbi:MAG: MFS transporter [Desulfosudaceae bacterium]